MGFEQRMIKAHRDAKLEARLVQWAREYGYGPADYLGYGRQNTLYRLERHSGYMPPPEPVRAPVATDTDQIERIVVAMERTDMWKHAKVLRIDYYRPNDAIESRLDRLKRMGVQCSKLGYEQYLEIAKEHVRISVQNIRKNPLDYPNLSRYHSG